VTTYFDHNATTPVHPLVLNQLKEQAELFGNPSSIHWSSRGPKKILRQTREALAKNLNVHPLELIFTSGASESNSTVLATFARLARSHQRCEIITTQIEHPSLLRACEDLQAQGLKVHYIKVDQNGHFDWEHFNQCLSAKTALVSVMHSNNETGLKLPIKEIAQRTHQAGAWMHSDCVQVFGKLKLDLQELQLDFASFSAHKTYALKGCGVLFAKRSTPLFPLIFGGGQERSRRGGTENTLAVWSLGAVLNQFDEFYHKYREIEQLRNYFENQVKSQIKGVFINHEKALRLPHVSSLLIDGIDGETLLMALDLKGYAVSTGAGDVVEVGGVAANHCAEGNERVVLLGHCHESRH
jgi:cysteine desulfurase